MFEKINFHFLCLCEEGAFPDEAISGLNLAVNFD